MRGNEPEFDRLQNVVLCAVAFGITGIVSWHIFMGPGAVSLIIGALAAAIGGGIGFSPVGQLIGKLLGALLFFWR
ncbi:MAG: hypothetical protein AAF986_04880 [Pseudomonadota bacterium]